MYGYGDVPYAFFYLQGLISMIRRSGKNEICLLYCLLRQAHSGAWRMVVGRVAPHMESYCLFRNAVINYGKMA